MEGANPSDPSAPASASTLNRGPGRDVGVDVRDKPVESLPLEPEQLLQQERLPKRSLFPPIADYGLLSDCEVIALVASTGKVEWMCLPRPDSPSVFGTLLDRAAGGFRLGPSDTTVPTGRRYVPGTNVLETTWQTASGWVIVRDALLIGPWYHERERSQLQRRPPTDYEAEGILLRTVECITGTVDLYL